MIKLSTSDERDIETIQRWAEQDIDPAHHSVDPYWWLTGVEGSLLAFRVDDEHGPVGYMRIDREGDLCRLHTQFAPREEVQKLRLVKAMLKCVPIVLDYSKQQQASMVVFQSTSELLIDFMKRKFGFEPAGGSDYQVKV